MKKLILLVLAALLFVAEPSSAAAASPNIVWSTNAHPGSAGTKIYVAFSPDGALLASSGGDSCGVCTNDQIKIWISGIGELVRTIAGRSPWAPAISISPLGDVVAGSGGTHHLKLWSIADGSVVQDIISYDTVEDDIDDVSAIAFTPDGQFISVASCCGYGLITMWRVSDASFVRSFGFNTQGGVPSLAISPDGATAAAGEPYYIWLFRIADGAEIRTLGPANSAPVFSPDGRILAVGARDEIALWNPNDGTLVRSLVGHSAAVLAVAFTPDGKSILSAGDDGTIRFWRVLDGALLQTYDQETTNITSLVVSPTGRSFGYARRDGTIAVAYLPVLITSITRNGTQSVVQWQGGSGLYQVQQCTNLTTGGWQNIGGSMSNNTATNEICNGNIFYRVQSLPNP